MHGRPLAAHRDWRIPDELWEHIVPLLPPRKPHPLGCHGPRVDDRQAMDAIFFVLRTGCQWNALHATGICFSSAAHRRFQEWTAAGDFLRLWKQGLVAYDALQGIDWEWLAMDGAMTKAPLGGKRWARTRPTGASLAPSAACSPKAVACRSASPWTGRIAMIFKMTRATVESIPIASTRADPRQTSGDGRQGYDYDEVRELLTEFGFTAHIRARGEEAKALKQEAGFRARRWVVERTHSWMNRFRRVLIRWDKKCATILGFCIWLVPTSPIDKLAYWDRLLVRRRHLVR